MILVWILPVENQSDFAIGHIVMAEIFIFPWCSWKIINIREPKMWTTLPVRSEGIMNFSPSEITFSATLEHYY